LTLLQSIHHPTHQYFEGRQERKKYEGESGLCSAILESALDAYLRGLEGRNARKYTETLAWLDEEDATAGIPFKNICETFDVDPAWFSSKNFDFVKDTENRRSEAAKKKNGCEAANSWNP